MSPTDPPKHQIIPNVYWTELSTSNIPQQGLFGTFSLFSTKGCPSTKPPQNYHSDVKQNGEVALSKERPVFNTSN